MRHGRDSRSAERGSTLLEYILRTEADGIAELHMISPAKSRTG